MIDKLKYICENQYSNFFNLPNVNGVSVGNKIIAGKDTGMLCLKILVESKVEKYELKADEQIPKIYNGLITDVVEVGKLTAQSNVTKLRPTKGGISIGIAGAAEVGTLGCLVSTGAGSNLKTYILSNNHVIASNNTAPIGSLILQPGQGDGGNSAVDGIANLSAFVPLNFSIGSTNIVDCAIAEVSNTSLVSKSIIDIGNIVGIASAQLNGYVQKSGRTTGYTTGNIIALYATVNVSYGSHGNAVFLRQTVTSPMSASGDSGSIILDAANRVIGLLFAGSGTVTIMNDIREVLKSFRARLI